MIPMKRTRLLLVCLLVIATTDSPRPIVAAEPVSGSAAATGEEPLRIEGRTMGSHYLVVIDSPGGTDPQRLKAEIETLLAEINRQMSNWDAASEISQFNRSTSTDWMPVGREFAIVVTEAARLHELTGGVLDPTLSPLVDAWGFGASRKPVVPDEAVIDAALAHVGMQHIAVRLDPPAIRKDNAAVQLNVSSLAPGFAVDELQRLLNSHRLTSHVIDVGGETCAGTAKHGGEPWRMGVESPLGGMHKILDVTEFSLATSGDYRNVHVINGTAYSHILDPRTGRPVVDPPASVSVAHRSCMTADGLATAMMVLGASRGFELATRMELDVMFLSVTESGELHETSRGRFADVPAE